jgi:hypothetical protein
MNIRIKQLVYIRPFFILLSLLSLIIIFNISTAAPSDAGNNKRRVNIPQLEAYQGDEAWERSAIFWFGKNEQGVPSRNYVDVRAYYRQEALEIRTTIVDYYLWYVPEAEPNDDLTQFDAIALYVDTNHDAATSPQLDDYLFLQGPRQWEDSTNYRRQARGTGSGWDTNWNSSWTNWAAMSWSDGGPNNNGSNIDYGWTGGFLIPWEALGLSGPPTEGTVWGLGVQLFDRDDPTPSGLLTPEIWPENFNQTNPSTWAELHFGDADYQPENVPMTGSTTIRATSETDNRVEDAWMGGGGLCGGGHNGGSEVNHGDAPDLFVGTETAETHFPCYNKSYLRFSLDDVPENKTILSATMTLHLWGNADQNLAQPSWVHLFSVKDNWNEMTIHWNNAPLAFENVDAVWMNPYSQPGNIQWPGDPYTWDATQAVAEAYEVDQPVSFAIYGSDTEQHSSKYLTSSETGDWNVAGRPRLIVTWGDDTAPLTKMASTHVAYQGDTVTYTLSFEGTGEALNLVDNLPADVSAPTFMDPGLNYAGHQLTWNGTPAMGTPVTLQYAVTITAVSPTVLINEATLTPVGAAGTTAVVSIYANPLQVFLPLIHR